MQTLSKHEHKEGANNELRELSCYSKSETHERGEVTVDAIVRL
jgi:hypothetical protein